jgi:hypothetical protein
MLYASSLVKFQEIMLVAQTFIARIPSIFKLTNSVVFFFSFLGWGETEFTWYVGHRWPIVPAPDDR